MIDISKWAQESMWNAVLNKQNLGLKYHHEMTEIFTLIDMKGYAKWQEYRMSDEGHEALKLEQIYIKKFNKIYPSSEMKDTLLNNSFMSMNKYSTDNKRSIIDEVFSAWLKWENSVSEMYMGCVQWCLLNQCEDYTIFTDMLKAVQEEKKALVYHLSKLQDSKFKMSDILEGQEYIFDKYKKKLKIGAA